MRPAPAFSAVLLVLSGCAGWPGMERPALRALPELRFIAPSELGLAGGPLALDVVYSVHPGVRLDPQAIRWASRPAEPGVDCQSVFRTLTRNVLAEVFRTAVETAPGSHVRLEQLQRSLASPDPELKQLPPLNAKALVLIDFRPPILERPDLPGQLLVHLYDISFPRYEDLSLSGPRLLIFEDYAEIAAVERPASLAGALVLAWREILDRMRASDRFRRYLALSAKPLDRGDPEWAFLLGLTTRDRIPSAPDSQLHEWIEKEILFVPPHEEVRPPPGPPPAAAAPGVPNRNDVSPPAPIFAGEGGGKAAGAAEGEKPNPPAAAEPPSGQPGQDPHPQQSESTEGR